VRRPFSLYRIDRAAGLCSVLYLARGAFTSGLAHKRAGDVLSLLGPLGRPFEWSEQPIVQHILVAGGLGAPPLYFLASELSRMLAARRPEEGGSLQGLARQSTGPAEAGVERVTVDASRGSGRQPTAHDLSAAADSRLIVINAARTESLLVGLTEFGDLDLALHVMTDDGSRGTRGMATDLLLALLEAEKTAAVPKAIYACGPMPMLRSVGEIALRLGLPCQLSIETTMPCGIGICQGCATPVRDSTAPSGSSYALACIDGPVFEARELVWT
jgi:dihydroorotate dehydrogenase electron transfer subunit